MCLSTNILHLATRTAASYIDRVGEFCRDKETFSAYVERMEMFLRRTTSSKLRVQITCSNKKRVIIIIIIRNGNDVYMLHITASFCKALHRHCIICLYKGGASIGHSYMQYKLPFRKIVQEKRIRNNSDHTALWVMEVYHSVV